MSVPASDVRHRAAPWLAVVCAAIGACKGGDDAATTDAATGDAGLDATAVDAAIDATPQALLEDDLGHVQPVTALTRAGDRALSVDAVGHWVLWDLVARAPVARGEAACPTSEPCELARADLRGGMLTVRTATGLELRRADTGAITATIATAIRNSGTASDGSYAWAASAAGLRLWRPDGSDLLTVAGAYSDARIFAAPTELRIALGAAGASMVELIRVADGARTTIPFNGTFHSWFVDGAKFLTTTGTVVRAYRLDGTTAGLGTVTTTENLTGQGDHVWTYAAHTSGYPLTIYPVASIGTPAQTYTSLYTGLAIPAGDTIGVISSAFRTVSVVTLGATVSRGPDLAAGPHRLDSYAADAGGWMIGNSAGVVTTGAGDTLGAPLCRGKLTSLAGTEGGLAALANSAGTIELVHAGAPPVVTRTIPLPSAHVELSTDGATLVSAPGTQLGDDRTLRVLSVATGAVDHAWPATRQDDPSFFDFTFARTGLVLARYFYHFDVPRPTYPRILTRTDGTVLPDYGPSVTADMYANVGGLHVFSPSGARAAITPAFNYPFLATTMLYQDGQLAEAVDGAVLGWLDDDRVLVAKYVWDGGVGNGSRLVSTTIYDGDGTVSATSPLPDLRVSQGSIDDKMSPVTAVGQGQIYVAAKNVVYDPLTAAVVWRGPAGSTGGTVAGDFVVYTIGPRLVVERFR